MSIEGWRTVGRTALLVVAVALALGSWTDVGEAAPPQAPFGDKVGPAILNYNRASPYIGTSGAYDPAAVAEVKRLGFTAVLDLRGSDESGVAAVAGAAKAAGLRYFHIPVTTKAPTDAQVQAFARIAADAANHPLLVNCVSANRVGAMWALYRAAEGVDPEVAIEEGRAVGLKPSREVAVRERLGLPPMSR